MPQDTYFSATEPNEGCFCVTTLRCYCACPNYRIKAGENVTYFWMWLYSYEKALLIQLNIHNGFVAFQKDDRVETGYHTYTSPTLWSGNRVDPASPLSCKTTPVPFHSWQLMSSRAKMWAFKYMQTNSAAKSMPRNTADQSRMATSRRTQKEQIYQS